MWRNLEDRLRKEQAQLNSRAFLRIEMQIKLKIWRQLSEKVGGASRELWVVGWGKVVEASGDERQS